MDRDGSNRVRLALDAGFETDQSYGINSEFYFLSPAWSPDGSQLFGLTGTDGVGFAVSPDGRQVIASVPFGTPPTPKVWMADLTTLESTVLQTVSDDFAWQRQAP